MSVKDNSQHGLKYLNNLIERLFTISPYLAPKFFGKALLDAWIYVRRYVRDLINLILTKFITLNLVFMFLLTVTKSDGNLANKYHWTNERGIEPGNVGITTKRR